MRKLGLLPAPTHRLSPVTVQPFLSPLQASSSHVWCLFLHRLDFKVESYPDTTPLLINLTLVDLKPICPSLIRVTYPSRFSGFKFNFKERGARVEGGQEGYVLIRDCRNWALAQQLLWVQGSR